MHRVLQLGNVYFKKRRIVSWFYSKYPVYENLSDGEDYPMYDLFEEAPVNYQSVVVPQFFFMKGALARDLATIAAYYHENVTFVPNEHLLVSLLLTLNVSMKRDLVNYVDTLKDNFGMWCNTLHLTNAQGYGKVRTPGVFYGDRTTEIIVAEESEFDIYEAYRNWRTLRPVRVLRHPFTDLSLQRPTGRHYKGRETGIAVISINVPMLAVQYRGWFMEERKVDEGPARRTQQFVSMYPLTNMIYSHLDVCLFNRLSALYFLEPVEPFTKTYPFYIQDLSLRVDEVLEKEIAMLRRRPLTFEQMLSSVPAISSRNLQTVMAAPKVVPTRHVTWALMVAKLPLVRFLLALNQDSGNGRNNKHLNRLRQALLTARNNSVLENILPREVLTDVDDMIHRDIEAYL